METKAKILVSNIADVWYLLIRTKSDKANATTLKFPSERDTDRRDRVSYEAMDLINSLLQEKEHRICSQKYKINDFQLSKRKSGQLVTTRANKQAQDYQGHYVYPDDAADIKAHSFFQGLAWDRLHLSRPPFVPDIKSRDDTKYFDDEDPISDVDDASSYCSAKDGPDSLCQPKGSDPTHVTQFDGAEGWAETAAAAAAAATAANGNGKKTKKVKEKKRPRDRVLRDKEVGRKVLELRKKGAFLGYTYRRPALGMDEEERGRQSVSRKS